jgi:hypothetical protein
MYRDVCGWESSEFAKRRQFWTGMAKPPRILVTFGADILTGNMNIFVRVKSSRCRTGMCVVTPCGVVSEYIYLSMNPEDGASVFFRNLKSRDYPSVWADSTNSSIRGLVASRP